MENGTPSKAPSRIKSKNKLTNSNKNIIIAGTVVFALLLIVQQFFGPTSYRGHIVISGDDRFKLSHSKDVMDHERRQLRLLLEKNVFGFLVLLKLFLPVSQSGRHSGRRR